MESLSLMIVVALSVVLVTFSWKALLLLVWRPFVITRDFRKQGVGGPPYKLWFGSTAEIQRIKEGVMELTMEKQSHDITLGVLPYYRKWIEEYGEPFLYWFGPQPRICITDTELIKQVLTNKSGFYTKIDPPDNVLALLGKGLVLIQGSDWKRHRSILSPAFVMDKLKNLTKVMAECAQSMLRAWEGKAENGEKEIDVTAHFQELTADVISQTAFGSSYKEGKEVFVAQRELQLMLLAEFNRIYIPGSKYLPTRANLHKSRLVRRMQQKLVAIIQDRVDRAKQDGDFGNDLLGVMLEANHREEGYKLSMDEIIDECKTFFFTGHETTSNFLTWTTYLLSINREWQERVREEVMRECPEGTPSADSLSKLKLLTMVLHESLRLYGPFMLLRRMPRRDVTLGKLRIPKGVMIEMPIMITHRKKEVWGDDAGEFNPLRFEKGTTWAAAHPHALLSFSIGPRYCIGQDFAMLEAKTVMAMILRRFFFIVSPRYIHAPAHLVTLQPQHGVPLLLRPLRTSIE